MSALASSQSITVTVNGVEYEREVEARKLLIHFIRDDLDLTGSHIGCDTGNCGACSVIVERPAREELHDARRPGRRRDDRDGRGARRRRRADAAAAVVQRPPRAPVRLLHARDADERDRAAARATRARPRSEIRKALQGNICRCTGYWNIFEAVKAAGASERLDDDASRSRRSRSRRRRSRGQGQSVPRKEDKRLTQGQGVFVDDIKRHGMGYIHFVRSPYAHAHITSIDVSKAEEIKGVYGTLTGEEVASLTDPFFQLSTPPGAHLKDYALAVGKVRYVGEAVVAVVAETRELARDASELVEVEYEPLDAVVDARNALDDGAAGAARGRGLEPDVGGRLRVGRPRRRVRRGGQDREDRRAPLPPLQLDAARVRRRARRVQPRHRASGRSTRTTSSPASRRS